MNAPFPPPVPSVLAPLANTTEWQVYFTTGALDRVSARDLIAAYDKRAGAASHVASALQKYLLTVIIRTMVRADRDLANPHQLEGEVVAALAVDLESPHTGGGQKLRNNFVRHVKAVSRARYRQQRKQQEGEVLRDIDQQLPDTRPLLNIRNQVALRRAMQHERDVKTRLIALWTLLEHADGEISQATNLSPKTVGKRAKDFMAMFQELRP